MHAEAFQFVETVRYLHPKFFDGVAVCEIGSRNVNGTVRDLFTNCQYVGVDAVEGPGVDVVSPGHLFESDRLFDVVISCECFEHCEHVQQTIDRMIDVLRPGGLFVSTHASPLRPEHGTRRTGCEAYSPNPDYYNQTLSVERTAELLGGRLDPVRILTGQQGQDVYVYGFKQVTH